MLEKKALKFFSGDSRSIRLKKEVMYSVVIKGVSILISLLFVPLILDFLDSERYGIWLTLSSIVLWFNFFDAGLGNGLRNKLTEAIAKNKIELAKNYISTTYALLSFIFLSSIILFILINPFIDWSKILNTTLISPKDLKLLTNIVFTLFLLRFIFSLIGTISLALQKPSVNNIFGPLANFFAILIIFIVKQSSESSSLIILGSVLSLTPLLVYIAASLFLFNNQYRTFRPSIKYVNFKYSKELLGVGLKLFVLQISALVFISSANFIIIQISNSNEVTIFNIAYKYMQLPVMLFAILSQPLWSASADAYYRNDFTWIKNAVRKYKKASILFVCLIAVLILLSSFSYKIWINNRVEIPIYLTIFIGIYSAIYILWLPYGLVINGIGKLRITLIYTLISIVIYFPIAIYLTNSSVGSAGVVISTSIIYLTLYLIQSIQVKKIINCNATGSWNK